MALSSLAMRLRHLRKPLTQLQLAEELGISGALVSSWENDKAVPPDDRLRQYAELADDPVRSLAELRRMSVQSKGLAGGGVTSTLAVLQDIRWLLAEIRDRLPPQ